MKFAGFQRTSFSDYPGKVASVVFTSGCNFRCPFCHNHQLLDEDGGQETQKIDEKLVFDYLNYRRGSLDGLVVSGGEPTLQRGLEDFLSSVRSISGLTIKLDTNGSRPRVLARLIEKGLVDYIAMDVKAPMRKYSLLCGCDVDNVAIAKSISNIMSSGIDYEFRTTAVRPLLDCKDIVEIGIQLRGAKCYIVQPFRSDEVLDKNLVGGQNVFTAKELSFLEETVSANGPQCRLR